MEPFVVYIIGDNRSGSTLLDYLLSFHPEAVSVGELHNLHGYYNKVGVGKRTDWKCSCGSDFTECEYWTEIIRDAKIEKSSETGIFYNENKWASIIHITHRKAISNLLKKSEVQSQGKKVAENRWRIYEAVWKKTGKKIIIDSSKNPFEAYFLNKFKVGQFKILLLERDIRAVAYSKMTRMDGFSFELKDYLNIPSTNIFKILLTSYKVLWRNRIVCDEIESKFSEVGKVLYSELSANPNDTIRNISDFLKIQYFNVPERTNEKPFISHVIHGSPSIRSTKKIEPDIRWQEYYKKHLVLNVFSKFLHLKS